MVKFITGEEYPHVCTGCRATIDRIAQMYRDDLLPDTDDEEAPSMYMYDHKLYCGGDSCANKPEDGDADAPPEQSQQQPTKS